MLDPVGRHYILGGGGIDAVSDERWRHLNSMCYHTDIGKGNRLNLNENDNLNIFCLNV